MRIYLAAMMQNGFHHGSQAYLRLTDRERQIVDSVKYRLDSYHYIGNERVATRIRSTGLRIFLDSGAFSAFTQGITVDVAQYCRYIKEYQDIIAVEAGTPLASVLDAIGDPTGTWINQKRMEDLGVRALPCYHYGEPPEVLQYYAANYDYITIGGMVPISTAQLRIWLDEVWGKYLTNSDGTPKIKVHGFGLTSVSLMARYPWYSVDSSSWVQTGGIGNIFLPQFGMVAISEHSPNIKEQNKHFDNLPGPQQQALLAIIERMGFDIERLRKEHLSRKVFNIATYTQIMDEEVHKNKRFRPLQPTLF